ncbi:MAG TPA: ribonuclease P protein component [Acetobacteraceae bacterium]|nr:ribonuclease P protein component [Acetobacteraceae bacterium]
MPRPPLRLKRRAEFLRVAAAGRKLPAGALMLQALARGDAEPVRVGFTVTRKVGNAVVRNRARRRLREAARLVFAERQARGFDLVLVGRPATLGVDFERLKGELNRALDRAGIP